MNELKSSLGRQPVVSPCRRRFLDDFKRDAVRLVVEEKYTFAAAACSESATFDELREENKRLRRQLKRAELEREILKKATAYFAKESL
jgi:transposase